MFRFILAVIVSVIGFTETTWAGWALSNGGGVVNLRDVGMEKVEFYLVRQYRDHDRYVMSLPGAGKVYFRVEHDSTMDIETDSTVNVGGRAKKIKSAEIISYRSEDQTFDHEGICRVNSPIDPDLRHHWVLKALRENPGWRSSRNFSSEHVDSEGI